MKLTKNIKKAIVEYSESFKNYWESKEDENFSDEYMSLMIKSAIERLICEIKHMNTESATFYIKDEALWYREKTI